MNKRQAKRLEDIQATMHNILDGKLCTALKLTGREIVGVKVAKPEDYLQTNQGHHLFVEFLRGTESIEVNMPLIDTAKKNNDDE